MLQTGQRSHQLDPKPEPRWGKSAKAVRRSIGDGIPDVSWQALCTSSFRDT